MPTKRQRRIEAGLCAKCGAPRGEGGSKIECEGHALERRARDAASRSRIRRERLSAGKCPNCGDERDTPNQMCSTCTDANKSYRPRRHGYVGDLHRRGARS